MFYFQSVYGVTMISCSEEGGSQARGTSFHNILVYWQQHIRQCYFLTFIKYPVFSIHKCTAFFHAVYYGHCTVYCILYSVLYSVHCVQCTVHCTVYCTQCTVYCTLCTVLAKSWFILKTVIFSGKIENNQCIIFVNYLCIY